MALFATCYGNYNEPQVGEDLVAVFEHNGIPVTLLPRERCCGMPKLELGDLEQVAKLKEENIPRLAAMVVAATEAGGRAELATAAALASARHWGMAFAAVQTLGPGVYVAMNGQVFDGARVRKDRTLGRFVATA